MEALPEKTRNGERLKWSKATDKESNKQTKQESPPAWTQEAYRPRRIKYYICCPVPGGYPPSGPGRVPPSRGYLPLAWGTPWAGGTPPWPGGLPPSWTWLGYPSWPGGVSPCGQTDGWTDTCQNITFPHTTYAVGNQWREWSYLYLVIGKSL